MEFVKELIVEDSVPEINVNGVATLERIAPNQMMITYYRLRHGERIVAARLVWDREEWIAQWYAWEANRREVSLEANRTMLPSVATVPLDLH